MEKIEVEMKEPRRTEGLRYNSGKLRYDLFEPRAMQELAKVFTRGAEKYAVRNWEKGMSWMTMLASLERHKEAWKRGEDYDPETGLLHMAQVAWNALAVVSYYKMYPQGDDRAHGYLSTPKIGLDIDEVICDFTAGWAECWEDVSDRPDHWYYDSLMLDRFESMRKDNYLDDFYLGLKPKIDSRDLPFEPYAYITSRPVDTSVTTEWLESHNFPITKVITVAVGESKVEAIKKAGIEIFVDDRFENFRDLNAAGICTYLWDAPHNQRYDVGYKRIKNLKDLV